MAEEAVSSSSESIAYGVVYLRDPHLQLEEVYSTTEVTDISDIDFLPNGNLVVVKYEKGKVKEIDFKSEEKTIRTLFKTSYRTHGIVALDQRCGYDFVTVGKETGNQPLTCTCKPKLTVSTILMLCFSYIFVYIYRE